MRQAARALVLLLLLGGCQATTGKTAGENVDDATVTASVKAKLVSDRIANLTRVDVDTNNGTVYLNGTVNSVEEKVQAEQIARGVEGVKDVINNLRIAGS